MTGRFIAKNIRGHAKNVTWNLFDCTSPLITVAPVAPPVMEMEIITKMEVYAFPNPTGNWFNIKVKTPSSKDVEIRIVDQAGKVLQVVNGKPDNIFRVGESFITGIYFAEIRQGLEITRVKLVKMLNAQ